MKRVLSITDLTRMQRGMVCIAGYDGAGRCVRPVLPPPGIPERMLRKSGAALIFPFAVVEFDLLRPTSKPPHTEDHLFSPASLRFVKRLTNDESRQTLSRSQFDSVAALFEQPIQHGPGFWVMDGTGPRSIGTVRPAAIHEVIYEADDEGVWDYRLRFQDGQGASYRLKITDLTWHYYCDAQRGENRPPAHIAADLTQMLQTSAAYLRIGLARGWTKFPERCFLQITAIHTFPDYLQGKTFADLAPETQAVTRA